MSIDGLLEQARRRGMFVRVSVRTSHDGSQYEVTLQARSLHGAGAKPLYRERFSAVVPVVAAIDDVADMAVHYIGFTGAAHIGGPAAFGVDEKAAGPAPARARR